MKVAVTIAVYNEERNSRALIESLLRQSRQPDEIVIVDDGSRDGTARIIRGYAEKYPLIKYIHQQNRGPAAARNMAWRNADVDICVFTDGDCVPEPDWLEKLLVPFADPGIGATAGTYKTLNVHSVLARFIGWEIAWKYRNVRGTVDAHGSYNLAVRKGILEAIGGFDETYPFPSGEDWDMTYKISASSKLLFIPGAIVGHYHPENFMGYMKNQIRRGIDRMKVYKDHPERRKGDVYTPFYIKYQVLAAGGVIPLLPLFYPIFKGSFLVPSSLLLFQVLTSLLPFTFFLKHDPPVAFCSITIQLCRNLAWFIGLVKGLVKFGI